MRAFTIVAVLAGAVAAVPEDSGLRRLADGHAYSTVGGQQANTGHGYAVPAHQPASPTASQPAGPTGHLYGVPQAAPAQTHADMAHPEPEHTYAIPQQGGRGQAHVYGLPGPAPASTTVGVAADDSSKISSDAAAIWVVFGIFVCALMTFPLCYYLYRRGQAQQESSQAREAPIAEPVAPEAAAPAPTEEPKEEPAAASPEAPITDPNGPGLLAENEATAGVDREMPRMTSDVSNQAKYDDVVSLQV